MMVQITERELPAGNVCRKTDAIRAKFRDVFGSECTLQDDMLLRRYSVTGDGDLILFVR
ncbi:MAG: hypothetical protein PHT99_08460 [Methanoregula sp.]|nr:hypothetical protein [Methanoregula sp.]